MSKVSVLMPAYNAAQYISDAIESILGQTYQDFELIIVDDGSTDDTQQIIERYLVDQRIICLQNEINEGLVSVRNLLLRVANGKYLAWLDSDDISLPTRLEKQVNLLDLNPDVGLCGTFVTTLGTSRVNLKYPRKDQEIKSRLLFDDPIATSSVMLRRSIVEQSQCQFNQDFPPAEDYDLWERLSHFTAIQNIPEFLTLYRIHDQQISTLRAEQQTRSVWNIQCRQLNSLGILPTHDEKDLHLRIGVSWNFNMDSNRLIDLEDWLLKIRCANRKYNLYPEPELSSALQQRFYRALMTCSDRRVSKVRRFLESDLVLTSLTSFRQLLSLIKQSIVHRNF